MIISRSYFTGIINIPNSKEGGSIHDNLLGNVSKLDGFIEEYERDVLVRCFGTSLYNLFASQLDSDNSNGLITNVDQKWDDLLNGKEYTIGSDTVNWRGLIYSLGDAKYSLIAYYVFYHFLNDDVETYTGTGVKEIKSKNAKTVSAIPKAVKAWRKFYELTVGRYTQPVVYTRGSRMGIDWAGVNGPDRSLYQFIQDQNSLVPGTYPDWRPQHWENMNTLGI